MSKRPPGTCSIFQQDPAASIQTGTLSVRDQGSSSQVKSIFGRDGNGRREEAEEPMPDIASCLTPEFRGGLPFSHSRQQTERIGWSDHESRFFPYSAAHRSASLS